MHPSSLIAEDTELPNQSVVGIIPNARPLTSAQRKFNRLVEQIKAQRQELHDWQVYRQSYYQQLGDHYQPAVARLRDKQIALACLLDRILLGDSLTKREATKTRDILTNLVSQLLGEAHDPLLEALHDKYSDRSFVEEQQERVDSLRRLAREELGVDVEAYAGGESPEEFADWLDDQIGAEPTESEQPHPRKKSAKAAAKEAQRSTAALGATQAIREVYRKLVSELHPDRETDAVERARKTELMQRVNLAYKAGDLLALLEVQLGIEQIDAEGLAKLAEKRLGQYNQVLQAQSRRLAEELAELVAPFELAMADVPRRTLSPASVQRVLDTDIKQVKELVRALTEDLIRFQHLPTFKRSLKDFVPDQGRDLDADSLDEPPPQRRRRRR